MHNLPQRLTLLTPSRKTRPRPKSRHQAALLLLASAGLLAAGCESVPRGESGGRIDPYRTTASDRASNSASIPAMMEFSDATVAALVQDLSEIDEIRNSPNKVVLELGSLANKTQTPSTDFEQIQARVRGQLFQSKLIRSHFIIVEGRGRMNTELNRVNGGGSGNGDLLQEGSTTAGGTARYDPKITYVLQGDFYESNRGDRRQYYFEFKLTNLASREQVFLKNFDLAQTH
ncbi:MAG: hypothetical protein NTW19_01850 [Planctomycetota bacterium]|nr:hypothetical protein [Planctomycetota bacterium]